MIKALLFDADGVLFFHTDKLFSDRLVEEYEVDPANLEHFFTVIFPECLVGKKDLKQELSSKLEEWGWTGSVKELMDYWFTYERNIDEHLVNYIKQARETGLRAYVATNNDHYRANWLFKQLNLETSSFDKLYASGDLGITKPDHGFFQMIMDDLPELRREEVLFWDDSPENVDSAAEVGLKAELYTTYENFMVVMNQYV